MNPVTPRTRVGLPMPVCLQPCLHLCPRPIPPFTPNTSLSSWLSFSHLPRLLSSYHCPSVTREDSDRLHSMRIRGISQCPSPWQAFAFSSCHVFPWGDDTTSCLSNWHSDLHLDNFCNQRNARITSWLASYPFV